MSRAFVNEDRLDDSGEAAPERIQSALPNYITPQGLEALSRKVEGLIAARDKASAIDDEEERRQQVTRIERDLRYFQTRLETAVPVDPNQSADDHVHFGSEVKVIDAEGRERTYVIVGEDEADPSRGWVSWASPLARALMNAREGEVVTFQRPSGGAELEVSRIRNARLGERKSGD